jgi:hypothetical protein
MPNDFFKLNNNPTAFETQADFLTALRTSDNLRNFIYQPDELQPTPKGEHPKLKIRDKNFTNASFSKTVIKNVILRKCTFTDCLFIGVSFENCEIHECKFENVNTHKIEIKETYLSANNFKNAITHRNYANIAVHLFQRIYDNLKDNDQPILARDAEYYFLDWERIYLIQKFKNKKIDLRLFLEKIITRQIHYYFGYGIRFTSFFLTYGIFLLVFGFVNYYFWDNYGIKTDLFNCEVIHTPIHVAYFTFYTTTSLGAGEMFPQTNLGISLAIIQSILGYIFIGVFLSMLNKKIVK